MSYTTSSTTLLLYHPSPPPTPSQRPPLLHLSYYACSVYDRYRCSRHSGRPRCCEASRTLKVSVGAYAFESTVNDRANFPAGVYAPILFFPMLIYVCIYKVRKGSGVQDLSKRHVHRDPDMMVSA